MTFKHPSIRAPHSKFDFEALEYLDTLPPTAWKHIIWQPDTGTYGLLDWTCDCNWPIFGDNCDLLLKNPKACIEPLRAIYGSDDIEWQFNVLWNLVARMPLDCRQTLAPDLRRWRETISEEDDEDGDMRQLVDEVLKGCE